MKNFKTITFAIAAVFYKDIQWKLLALVLAFILWFVGISINNPIRSELYHHLPLRVLGMERLVQNGIVVLNQQELDDYSISVSIRTTADDHETINAARDNNIQAFIDLSVINLEQILQSEYPVAIPLAVEVFVHQNYVIKLPDPNSVTLQLDRLEERLMPISVDIRGEPMEGYEPRGYQQSPRVVRLTGARSILNEAADVRVSINIGGAYQTVEEPRNISVYNSNNENITSKINLNVPTTNVVVPVLPYADIRLVVSHVGSPLPGFMATNTTIYPSVLSLVGDEEVIANTASINLGDIDIALATNNVEQTFNIANALTGTGLTLRESTPTEALVTVTVERVIERTLELPLEQISVGGYTRPFAFVTEEDLTLALRGRESVVSGLTLNQIGASLDLTGLGAGIHLLQVEITPPPYALLTNVVTVEISIEPETIVLEPPNEELDFEEEE